MSGVEFAVAAEILTLAGAPLIDLDDSAAGYELVSSSMPDEAWRSIVVTSPVVDGDFEVQSVLAAARLELIVRVKGDTWPQVESRRIAMRATWADSPSFLIRLSRGGAAITWRARRPNVSGSVSSVDMFNLRRVLLLSFPVQPNPTVTGV